MKDLWYVHITHRNKPKNRLYEELYNILSGLDGFGIDNVDAHKEAVSRTIHVLNLKHPRTEPIHMSWSKSKTVTGKEMWMLHVPGIGYRLLRVYTQEDILKSKI